MNLLCRETSKVDTCKIRDISFWREYGTQSGTSTNVNNLSRICLETQSRASTALNSPQTSPSYR